MPVLPSSATVVTGGNSRNVQISMGPDLPIPFAALDQLRALLAAIRAFAAIGFQTCRHSVISLDLTGIIAFDAFREWEAVHRQRCGPGVGRRGSCTPTCKTSGLPGKHGRP